MLMLFKCKHVPVRHLFDTFVTNTCLEFIAWMQGIFRVCGAQANGFDIVFYRPFQQKSPTTILVAGLSEERFCRVITPGLDVTR